MSEPTSPYGRRGQRLARRTPVAGPAVVPDTVPNRFAGSASGTSPYASRPEPRAAPPRSRRRGYLLVALIALLLVGGRVLHDSWSALRAGDAASARQDRGAAAREYLHAVRMYLPGSPFVARALDRLEALARAAAVAGDVTTERQAWEAVRAGLLGARSLYTPYAGRLEEANRRLASLYARIEDEAVAPGAGLAERERWHARRLAVQPGPAVGATVAALFGLCLWLGASVTFVRRGLDRGLRLDRRWAMFCGVGFLVGFALFVVGLRLA